MSYISENGIHSSGYKSDSLEGFLSSGSESSLEESMETEEKSKYDSDDHQIGSFVVADGASLNGFLSSGSESSVEESMETEEKSQYDDSDYQSDSFCVSDSASEGSDGSWHPDYDRNLSSKHLSSTSTIVTDLTEYGRRSIVGREIEAEWVIRNIKAGQLPVLVGPAQVGKQSIMVKVAQILRKNKQQSHIYQFNCTSLVAIGNQNPEVKPIGRIFENEISKISKKKIKPIFYFKDINRMVLRDDAKAVVFGFLQSQHSCIASVSGEFMSEDAQKTLETLRQYNVSHLQVKECSSEETKTIVLNELKNKPLEGGIKISKQVLNDVIELSAKYLTKESFPNKALFLIRHAAYLAMKDDKENIDKKDIAKIIEEKTGMPQEDVEQRDFEKSENLNKNLKKHVVGQDQAIDIVCKILETRLLGFGDQEKPKGMFLFLGPTGVGKTELAKQIANLVYKGNIVFVDMAQYKEEYSAASLTGAAPGLVGYEEGVHFINEMINKPHSVVLFDEIEKAHPKVLSVLLRAFNEGYLIDTKGRKCSFKNTTIVMTSNLGSNELQNLNAYDVNEVLKSLKPLAIEKLSPEFCNRITAYVPFKMLHNNDFASVIQVHLKKIHNEYRAKGFQLKWEDSVVEYFRSQKFDNNDGMRGLCSLIRENVDHALTTEKKKRRKELKGSIMLTVSEDVLTVKSTGFKRLRKGVSTESKKKLRKN